MYAPKYTNECIYYDISNTIVKTIINIKNYLNNILLFCQNYIKVNPKISYLFILKHNFNGASIFLIGPSKDISTIKTIVDPIFFGGYSWNELKFYGLKDFWIRYIKKKILL